MNRTFLPLDFNDFASLDIEEGQGPHNSLCNLKLNSDFICVQTQTVQIQKSFTTNTHQFSSLGYFDILLDDTTGRYLKDFINNLNKYFGSEQLKSRLNFASKQYIPKHFIEDKGKTYFRVNFCQLSKLTIINNGNKVTITSLEDIKSLLKSNVNVKLTLDISRLWMSYNHYTIPIRIIKIDIIDNVYLPLNDMKSIRRFYSGFIDNNKSKINKSNKIIIEI